MSKHINGIWCADLHCAKCYGADTWQKSELLEAEAALRRVVEASDRFVKDTGLKHGDLITDAVDAARPIVDRARGRKNG